MAINVTFYNFTKRYNSTAQPSGGDVVECNLRDGSDKFNPSLEIRGISVNSYNYMYIPLFGRYYYITGCTWNAEQSFWLIEGQTDVLATFRTPIHETVTHVTRSASAYDDTIADGLAVPIGKTIKLVNAMTGAAALIPNLRQSFYNATVIVNIAGSGLVMMNGTNYDQMMLNFFAQHDPLTNEYWTQDIARNIINPASYIISAMALPIDFEYAAGAIAGGAISPLRIGWYEVTGVTAYWVSGSVFSETTSASIPIHPQAESENSFLNYPPFSDYKVYLSGIGLITLDSSKINPMTDLTFYTRVDCHTGGVTVRVMQGGVMIGFCSGTIGYNLAVTNRQSPDMVSMISNVLIGGAVGGVTGVLGGAAHALTSLNGSGSVSVHGNTGGAAAWSENSSRIIAEFKRVKFADNASCGRAYYQSAKLGNLSGYVEVLHGSVNCRGTQAEKLEIKNILEGGVYIE